MAPLGRGARPGPGRRAVGVVARHHRHPAPGRLCFPDQRDPAGERSRVMSLSSPVSPQQPIWREPQRPAHVGTAVAAVLGIALGAVALIAVGLYLLAALGAA